MKWKKKLATIHVKWRNLHILLMDENVHTTNTWSNDARGLDDKLATKL